MNIVLPTLPNKQDAAETVLESLQTLETARALLGPEAIKVILTNDDLISDIQSAAKILRRVRPSNSRDKVRRELPPITYLKSDARRINFEKQPLNVRLECFKEKKVESVRSVIEKIFSIERTDRPRIKLLYGNQTEPRAEISRRKGYRDRWYYNYDVQVHNTWLLSGAYELAKAFGYKFFPLTCAPIRSEHEEGLTCYSVTRLVPFIKAHVNCRFLDPEEGFAYFDHSGATGWGDTSDKAYANLRKARAKIARDRLLQSFKS